MAKKCFAMEKDKRYCDISDMRAEGVTCYVLRQDAFRQILKHDLCCTKACPFYKEKRGDVRLD